MKRVDRVEPCAVSCESMNPDSTRTRRPEIEAFGRRHRCPVVSVADLIRAVA